MSFTDLPGEFWKAVTTAVTTLGRIATRRSSRGENEKPGQPPLELEELKAEVKRLRELEEHSNKQRTELERKLEAIENELNRIKEQHIEELKNASEASFLGWFDEPPPKGLMGHLTTMIEQTKSQLEHIPIRFHLALDFSVYGCFSWNDEFERQAHSILSICDYAKKRGIRPLMLFNDDSVNEALLEKQYPEKTFDAEMKKIEANWNILRRSPRFLEYSVGSKLFKKFVSNEKIHVDDRSSFFRVIREFNEKLVVRFLEAGATVYRHPSPVPFHGWLFSTDSSKYTEPNKNHGVFSLADQRAVWNEPGFRISGEVAKKFILLFEELRRTAKPQEL